METLFFSIMGWCGTKYPGWWLGRGKPRPDPWKPQPVPWKYIVLSAIGIIIGAASGLFFKDAVANNSAFAGQGMMASGLFSFAASNILTGIGLLTMKTQKQ